MLKRSVLYLRRKYKRSMLLLILLFVISFSLAVGLTVWGSSNTVTQEVQHELGTSFVVTSPAIDSENSEYFKGVNLQNGGTAKVYTGPKVNQELLDAITQIDGISNYNAEDYLYGINVKDLTLIVGSWGTEYALARDDPEWLGRIEDGFKEWGVEFFRLNTSQTQLYGNTNTELYSKFRTGAFELVEGRHISADDSKKALISDELAKLNGLTIGDTITLNLLGASMNRADKVSESFGEAELEIVGIFHVNGYQPTGINIGETDITYNWILTDIETVEALVDLWCANYYQDYIPEQSYINLTFFVDDPSRLETVVERVKNSDIPNIDFFQISLDDTMYKSTVDPLNSIRNLVAGLVAAIVVGCMAILLIVFTMWVRSRRQEVAIYLSLGFSKFKIIGQFVLEAVIVAAIAFAAALPASIPVADTVGNQMLTSAIEAAQPSQEEYSEEEILQAARSGAASELYQFDSGSYGGPEHIDFTFGLAEVLILVALELLIIVAAICKGGSFIFKLQPRQILTTLS